MNNNQAIHRFVAEYNWDDGFLPIWPIVESNETEMVTALMIYWRLEGPWLERGSEEARRLHSVVTERLLSGFYRLGELRYDPVADTQISRTQIYKLKKAGVPNELIEPHYLPPDH
ncbi:MAG: DUF4274 domain-containing protein [Planctomycetota bacterium]